MKTLSFFLLIFFTQMSFAQQKIELKDLSLFNPYVPVEQFNEEMANARVSKLRNHKVMTHVTFAFMLLAGATAMIARNQIEDDRAMRGGAKSGSDASNLNLHMALGGATLASYYTAAYMSLSAPKPKGVEDAKKVSWHKRLAWIHGPAMIAAPFLGLLAYKNYKDGKDPEGLGKLHRPVMWAGVAAYTVSFTLMSMDF